MTCHTLIKSPAPPAGDCAGASLSSRPTAVPAVEPIRSGGGGVFSSFDLIHNPRAHVCGCGVGYVRKPDYCHSCGAPMWFDVKQVAREIMKEMEE